MRTMGLGSRRMALWVAALCTAGFQPAQVIHGADWKVGGTVLSTVFCTAGFQPARAQVIHGADWKVGGTVLGAVVCTAGFQPAQVLHGADWKVGGTVLGAVVCTVGFQPARMFLHGADWKVGGTAIGVGYSNWLGSGLAGTTSRRTLLTSSGEMAGPLLPQLLPT